MEGLEEVVVGQILDPFEALMDNASFRLVQFKLVRNLGNLTEHPVENRVFPDFEVEETLA